MGKNGYIYGYFPKRDGFWHEARRGLQPRRKVLGCHAVQTFRMGLQTPSGFSATAFGVSL